MLALGAIMAAEKNLPWGRRIGRPLGAGLVAAGLMTALVPALTGNGDSRKASGLIDRDSPKPAFKTRTRTRRPSQRGDGYLTLAPLLLEGLPQLFLVYSDFHTARSSCSNMATLESRSASPG